MGGICFCVCGVLLFEKLGIVAGNLSNTKFENLPIYSIIKP